MGQIIARPDLLKGFTEITRLKWDLSFCAGTKQSTGRKIIFHPRLSCLKQPVKTPS
jgi:hypothetical protein